MSRFSCLAEKLINELRELFVPLLLQPLPTLLNLDSASLCLAFSVLCQHAQDITAEMNETIWNARQAAALSVVHILERSHGTQTRFLYVCLFDSRPAMLLVVEGMQHEAVQKVHDAVLFLVMQGGHGVAGGAEPTPPTGSFELQSAQEIALVRFEKCDANIQVEDLDLT